MTIQIATLEDWHDLCNFYETVCAQQANDEYTPVWHWGDYPSPDGLRESIEQKDVIMNLQDGQVAAAGVLSVGEDPTYQDVPWKHSFKDNEIAVLHLFAVDKSFRGRGIAQSTLQAAFDHVHHAGQKVIHLDIIDPNLPAEKAYLKAGFTLNNCQLINYADLGPTPAKLFEYVL